MHVLYILLCVIQFFVGIGLIVIVTIQESKNDGLQGQIGTAATSSFKGKAGREEQLTLLTRNTAIVFMTVSVLVALGSHW
jgi:protein translocase SecG subunit